MLNFSLDFKKIKETLLGTKEKPTALWFLPGEIKKTFETKSWMPEPLKKMTKFLETESIQSRAQKDIMRGVPADLAYQTAKKKERTEKIMNLPTGFMGGGMENVEQTLAKKAAQVISEESGKVSNYLKSKVSTTLEKTPIWQGLKDKTYSGLNRLYTATIDRFNPINKITKEATKVGKVLPGENPELLARRYLGVKSIAESKIFWKTTEMTSEGNLKVTGEGLSNILKPIRDNLDDLRVLMVAERDLELAGRGMKGVTPKESQEVLDILKKKPNYNQLQQTARGVRDYAKNAILNPLKEIGAISDETYTKITQSNQFYIPFKRVMEEIETQGFVPAKVNLFTPKSVPIKTIKGSEKAIIDPLESLISDTYKVTDFIERERVAKAVVNLRNQSPELAEMIKPVGPKMVPVARIKEIESVALKSPSRGLNKVIEEEAKSLQEMEIGLRGGFTIPTAELEGGVEFTGKIRATEHSPAYREFFQLRGRAPTSFNDWKEMAKNNLNKGDSSVGLEGIYRELLPDSERSKISGIEQGIKTIFRPSFFPPAKNTIQVFENGARKFYQVEPELAKAMNGMSGSDMGIVMKILALPTKTLRAGATLTPEFIGRNPIRDQFSAFVYSKYGYNPPVDLIKGIWETIARKDLFQRWMASGGDQSMFVSLDRISSQKKLKEVSKLSKFTPQGALNVLKKFIREPLSPVRALSAFGEKGTRVGAFKKALKKGATDIEAAFESRDITLDFSRLGSQTKAVNQIIAFWNANVQGLDKMVRTFKERKISTSLKAISGITLPSIGLYLLNKDNLRYKEIPQYQKDLFWIIIPPGEKSPIIRIPKPFELGIIFGTVPEHILAWIDKNDPEALTSIPSAISKAASPGFIPTALLPILENTANYSFFRDRPIVSQSVQNLPPGLQASTYTSETAKEIGKIMNYSPAKIENMAQGYFGGLGNYAIDASDLILKGAGIVSPPTQPSPTLADIPGIKGFIVREPIGSASESVNKFYDIREKATQAYNAAKDMADKGDIDGSVKYLKQHKEALFYKGLNKAASSLSDIRKGKEKVLVSNVSPEQKRRAIDGLDTLMTEIAKQVLIVINEQK